MALPTMPTPPESADLVIDARWVVPVEPDGAVLEDHSVIVRDGRVVALLPTAQAAHGYEAARRVKLDRHTLIPGLINLHTHAAMSLMRGLADDRPLMEWLKEHVWPVEMKHVSPEFVYDGTLLACAEMLRGGVTCFNDMYFFPEAAARACRDSGMRASLGLIAAEFPSAYASDADDYLAKGLEFRDRLGAEARISFCMAPHAPYTVSDRTFARLATLAEELDLPVHIHLHETDEEIRGSVAMHGRRPIGRLEALGLVSPRLIGVHAVHLTEAEVATLSRNGCSVAHCPSSNLKLASGFAPVAALLGAGVNLGIGTDGAASNNRLDMFQEMRTAALLAKAVAGRADTLPAHVALRCATLGGARALGLDARIGSITPGKAADLCAVSMDEPETQPCYDPVSHLVYACGREHVTHVWVGGEPLVAERTLLRFDTRVLEKRTGLWQNKLLR
ncbi:MAG TPA: TRZ/ATZ family hydrolase [Burkholderiales bacterium]|nr:TRZ/ATZ family hydrolase [Burkholderiales bacterium]